MKTAPIIEGDFDPVVVLPVSDVMVEKQSQLCHIDSQYMLQDPIRIRLESSERGIQH